MAGKLDRACLVDIDVGRLRTDYAFVGLKYTVDNRGIGLRATRQKQISASGASQASRISRRASTLKRSSP